MSGSGKPFLHVLVTRQAGIAANILWRRLQRLGPARPRGRTALWRSVDRPPEQKDDATDEQKKMWPPAY